jgi:hypothetical protein
MSRNAPPSAPNTFASLRAWLDLLVSCWIGIICYLDAGYGLLLLLAPQTSGLVALHSPYFSPTLWGWLFVGTAQAALVSLLRPRLFGGGFRRLLMTWMAMLKGFWIVLNMIIAVRTGVGYTSFFIWSSILGGHCLAMLAASQDALPVTPDVGAMAAQFWRRLAHRAGVRGSASADGDAYADDRSKRP